MPYKNSHLNLALVGLLLTSMSAYSHASSNRRFVKIEASRVKNVQCFYHETNSYNPFSSDEFQLKLGETIVARELLANGANKIKFDACNAAVLQAQQESSALYVDVDSAEVVPENGFFVQKAQCK